MPDLPFQFSNIEPGISNNVAELRAILRALQVLLERQKEEEDIIIFTDSRVAQLIFNSRKQKLSKHSHLAVEQRELFRLKNKFKSISASWIPREQNWRADAIALGLDKPGNHQ